MVITTLAHGGQLTGDEIAFIGGGTAFALLFPVVVLVIAARRARSAPEPADADLPEPMAGDDLAPAHSGLRAETVASFRGSELDLSKERKL